MFTVRFFIGLVMLLIAVFLQFFFLPLGVAWNILFAILISFAFIFDFLAFLLFDLLAVFLVNWQPGPSVALIAFAVIPLIVFAFRTAIRPEAWVGVLMSILAGFALFYAIVEPSMFLPHFLHFLIDVAVGAVVAELALMALPRTD